MADRVLGDLADITVGHVGPMAHKYVATGIPFIRSLNIQPFRISLDGVKYIDEDFHQELKKSQLKPGDVVVVRTGKPGTAAVVPSDLRVANCSDVVIVRPRSGLDSRFLAYYVNGVANGFVYSRTVGAVQQHFNVGQAKEMPIPEVDLAEQRRIAEVLGALDELIDVDRRLARQCSDLAEATWTKMVSGSQEGRRVDAFANVVLGGTPSRKEPSFWGGDVPWINSGEANEFRVLQPSEYISAIGLKQSSAKLMPIGTTILAITGATLGQVSRLEIESSGNQSLVGVWSDDPAMNDFAFFGLCSQIETLLQSATGGAQQHVNKGNVEELVLPWLPDDAIRSWHQTAQSLMAATSGLLFEALALERARDELLPLLMSGRVRVKDVAA